MVYITGCLAESGYSLSVKELMWDPQKVQADLKSRFGFDDLHAERVLNYSADLQEVHTLWVSPRGQL